MKKQRRFGADIFPFYLLLIFFPIRLSLAINFHFTTNIKFQCWISMAFVILQPLSGKKEGLLKFFSLHAKVVPTANHKLHPTCRAHIYMIYFSKSLSLAFYTQSIVISSLPRVLIEKHPKVKWEKFGANSSDGNV